MSAVLRVAVQFAYTAAPMNSTLSSPHLGTLPVSERVLVRLTCLLLSCLSFLLNPVSGHVLSAPSGTAPFILDGNRVYAQLEFIRPDGTLHKTFAFVDFGSASMVVSWPDSLIPKCTGCVIRYEVGSA